MNHIELFAGCGGLSIGMEAAGFKLLMANELSPMAAETFSFNILKENLREIETPENVVWLSSAHSTLENRLRENPFTYPDLGSGVSDLVGGQVDLNGKLVVANIAHFNQLLAEDKYYNKNFDGSFYGEEVDVVSGGPPCQSFSMAGLRKKDCDKNTLPFEFCNFVERVKPKLVLLENVSGILRAFTQDGEKHYAWFEVAKAFALIGYIPVCLHVNARYAGVPQNRPRFILIGIRENEFERLRPNFNTAENQLFAPSLLLRERMLSNQLVEVGEYVCFDYQKETHLTLLHETFLKELFSCPEVTVAEAIGDLLPNSKGVSEYVQSLNHRYGFLDPNNGITNNELRNHGDFVKMRFRLYQLLNMTNKAVRTQVLKVLRGKETFIYAEAWAELSKFKYYLGDGHFAQFTNLDDFISYLEKLKTKKHSQKALLADEPAPAALSIPDDFCHYDESQLRTLTIREMARIQSFPDMFCFRSKVTTGGKQRQYEVPQYTQVGNAVPPNLGYKLGQSLRLLLERGS